jgi:hypothetical protein
LFGAVGSQVSVIVLALGGATDGTGGADHMGCDYQTGNAIEVCASFGNSARVSALFEAELSECSMGGDLCGVSTGESLSRWCAMVVGHNALPDFATAPQWAQDGMPNFVDRIDPSDQNGDSIGCGMAFLSWLISQGHRLDQIAPAMVELGQSASFAQLYENQTSDRAGNAWPSFQAAVQALSNGVTSDDPFDALAQPAQFAHQSLWTVALASKVFSSILLDVSRGKTAEEIVAGVRSVLPGSNGRHKPATCHPQSRPLLPPDKAGKS